MNENFRYWQKLAYILLIAGIVFCWLPGGAALFGLGLALCVHLLGALSRTERFLKESRQNLRVISRSILKDRSVVEKDVTEELCLQWQGKAPLDLCLLETIPLPGLEYQGKVKHGLFFPANQEVRVINTLRSHTAGRLSLGEVRAKISDDWGLFEVERSLEAPCQPIFYPPVYQKLQLSPQVAMGLSPMLGIHRLSRAGEGSELHEIRDYQSGDSYRKMLWGATARSGRLMVRDFAAEVNIPVVFVLNTSWYLRFGSPKMMFDQLVETAMVLADATYEAGDPFGFCLYGDQEFPMHVSCVLPAHRRHQVTELMKSLLQIRAHQAPPPVLNLPELEKSVRKLLVGRAESLQSYYKHSSLDKELVRQGLAPQGFEKTDDLQYAAVLAQIANRFGLPTPVLHSHFKASDSVEYQLECEEIERLDKLLVRLIPQIKDKALFVVSMRPYESGESLDRLCRVLSLIPRQSHRLLVLYPDYPSYTKRGPDLPRNIDFCMKLLKDGCLPTADVITAMDFYTRRDTLRRKILQMGGCFENIDAKNNINFIIDMINHQRYSQGGQNYA